MRYYLLLLISCYSYTAHAVPVAVPEGSGTLHAWAAASPLRSATYITKHAGANQIASLLPRHCSGPARCCSQPTGGWYMPTAYSPTDRPIAWGHHSKSL